MTAFRITIPLLAVLLLASCQNSSHLIVYQHSNLGFNVGVNPETSNVHVRLGLRQEVGTIVPKVDLSDEEGGQEQSEPGVRKTKRFNAASAYAAVRMNTREIYMAPEVNEIVASGQAAINLASSPKKLDPFTQDNTTNGTSSQGGR